MKILTIIMVLINSTAFAQSIRKNYAEMSDGERSEYVRVMNVLYADGVISNFVASHQMPTAGFAQHGNDDFLPWHRMFLYYMDAEIKQRNRYLNLGYVNWYNTVTRDEVLFSNGTVSNRQGLLGFPLQQQWDAAIVDRRFQSFATSATMTTSALTSYGAYRRNLEESAHNNFHNWVGGTMASISNSPLDPVFYFHHAMVDKAWEDWNQTTWNKTDSGRIRPNLGSIIGRPTYNGKDIFDSRSVKVWYAEFGILSLNRYTVSNQTLGVTTGKEFYFYPRSVEVAGTAANYFTVPSGTEAKIESMLSIALLPGFSVEPGATFGAEIISAFPTGTGFGGMRMESDVAPFKIEAMATKGDFTIYPNPNNGTFFIVPNGIEVYKVEIFNLSGHKIASIANKLEIKTDMTTGVYLAVVTDMEGILHSKKFLVD